MGTMTTCAGEMNDNLSTKEIKFNLMGNHLSYIRDNKVKLKNRSQSISKIHPIIKEEDYKNDYKLFKFEESNNQIYNNIQKNNNKKILQKKNENKKFNSFFNNFSFKDMIKEINSDIKQIDKKEEECDIIECEDDFECDQNIIDLIKNVDINNKKRSNYFHENNKIIKHNKYNNEYIEQNNISNDNDNKIIINNELLNDSYINNKDLNMELSESKNKNNGSEIQSSTIFENLINNEGSIEKCTELDTIKMNQLNEISINDNNRKINNICEEEKNLHDININCYENKNSNMYINKKNIKLIKNKEENKNEIDKKIKNNKIAQQININDDINNKYKKNKNNDFQNCKIDNNINININNNLNNINTINNISTINNNSDINNNNYIDVSSNMTYFLSVEKSHRRPATSIIDKNIFSLKKNNFENNNNITYNKVINNNLRNSAGLNKYKWKLYPKHKYNTQICKSFCNNQSISINEEKDNNQKNSQLTTIIGKELKNINHSQIKKDDLKNEKKEEKNNLDISEYKKQKKEQDKKIKVLKNKIKSLYKIIKEEKNNELKNCEKISKLEEYIAKRGSGYNNTKIEKQLKLYKNENIQYKKALNDIKFVESQKDYRIKKLEEQLQNIKKNNKINKNLIIKKDKQIKNLLESKNKQDELIKKYEILKDNQLNNNNSTKGTTKINYFDNLENTTNNLLEHKNSISFSTKNNISMSKTLLLNNSSKNINKSLNLKNEIKYNNSNHKNKKMNRSNSKLINNKKKPNIKKEIYENNISNFTEIFNIDQETFQKENSKINNSQKRNSFRSSFGNNSVNKKSINIKSINNKSSVNERNINYNNYCNSLSKSKNNYNNKISLNRIKMYKLNNLSNLSINQISNKKINKNNIKPKKLSLKKNFSFKKSKKLSKDNIKDLKEIYLNAGKVQNYINDNEKNILNNDINNVNNKLYPDNNILYRNNISKNNITNSNNNTTITNNITNLSMSPIIISGFHNIDNLSIDDKLNLSENINNNINNFNNYLRSVSNDEIEKEKNESNKIYKKLWNEGFLRYEEMCKNKKYINKDLEKDKVNKINENYWKINFGMANELIEINIDKNDFMFDVKNRFLNNFFEKKIYGDIEKKYITDNILFLNKEGIVDMQKKVNESNINNNEIIIPVLKDVT